MSAWLQSEQIKDVGRQQIPPGPECIAGYTCDFLERSYCSLLHDLICLIETPEGWKHYKLPKCPRVMIDIIRRVPQTVEEPHLIDEEREFIRRWMEVVNEPVEKIANPNPFDSDYLDAGHRKSLPDMIPANPTRYMP